MSSSYKIEEFTFGVLSYNQEDLILDLLESIRYQIEKYGAGIRMHIVIADDCSKDNTVFIEKKWLEENAGLFDSIDIIVNEKNLGTVKNYHSMMTKIKTNYFKNIAGDDVFADKNLFEGLESNGNDEIKAYMPVTLTDGKIELREDWFARQYRNLRKKRSHQHDRIQQAKGSYFHTPTTFFEKRLYDNYYCDLGLGLKLFEDDELVYTMFKNDSKLKVNFIDDYKVLYRFHSMSVCQSAESPFAGVIREELRTYKKYLYSHEKNINLRLALFLQLHRPKNKYLDLNNYIGKAKIIINTKTCKLLPSYRCRYNEYIKDMERTQGYYVTLHEIAVKKKEEYLSTIES